MNKIIHAFKRGDRVDFDGNLYNANGRQLTPQKRGNGYLFFRIKINEVEKIISVHRLQAYQKFGISMFKQGLVVRHLDGNMYNNSSANISIGTIRDNHMDMPSNKRKIRSSKPRLPHAEIISEINKGNSIPEIATKFKSSRGAIYYIVKSSLKSQGII